MDKAFFKELRDIVSGLVRQPFSLKELWGRMSLLAQNSAGNDIQVLAENDGTLEVSNYGKASTTKTAFKVETTGEQDIVLHGKDSGATIDPLRTNSNQQLQVEVVQNAKQVDAVVLTASNVAVYNPGSTASEIYDVWFTITNIGTAPCVVSVGVDLGGGTTLDRSYWDGYTVPPEESTGWHYIGRIAGDDDVVAKNATAATVTATIFLKVDQLA